MPPAQPPGTRSPDDGLGVRAPVQDALVTHPVKVDRPAFTVQEVFGQRRTRTGIAHEGVQAQQMALGWRNPDQFRCHYYDPVPNEGIAFCNEELPLAAGLIGGATPGARFIANSPRLRGLRAEAEIALAPGDITLEQAADRLATRVPVDRQTAWEEAVFFAGSPGLGLAYQTGKLQILNLLAAAAERHGASFGLQQFHDRLLREGHIPLALQGRELLGLHDQQHQAERLAEVPS